LRIPIRLGDSVLAVLIALAERLGSWPIWILAGILIGVLPFGLELATGVELSRPLTALLLTPLFAAAVARDWTARGLGLVGIAFLTHSVLAICLYSSEPGRFPAGLAYWEETRGWIDTGISREYDVGWWLPAHFQLLAAIALFSYTSLGLIPFWQGLYEVDLMNCYVGQLLAHASNPALALTVGWHPWSLCRGVGYLFLAFEIASLSLERFSGQRLSSPGRRAARWLTALGFLTADSVLKYFLLEPVRQTLAAALG
jgi:hypothetical protein